MDYKGFDSIIDAADWIHKTTSTEKKGTITTARTCMDVANESISRDTSEGKKSVYTIHWYIRLLRQAEEISKSFNTTYTSVVLPPIIY
jgi:hypothetical protein